jgi:hypothetical protein
MIFLSHIANLATGVGEEKGNLMDAENLATVIAPNICYPSKEAAHEDSLLAISVVKLLIEEQYDFCMVGICQKDAVNYNMMFPGSRRYMENTTRAGDSRRCRYVSEVNYEEMGNSFTTTTKTSCYIGILVFLNIINMMLHITTSYYNYFLIVIFLNISSHVYGCPSA